MKQWYLGIGLVFLMACGPKIPENLISQEKMAEILVEFHLSEAITDSHIREFEQKKLLKDDLFDEILKKNNLDREPFFDSYSYYIDHPTKMDSIYKNVIENLGDYLKIVENENYLQKNEAAKNDTVRQKRIDSLRKANRKVPELTPPAKKN